MGLIWSGDTPPQPVALRMADDECGEWVESICPVDEDHAINLEPGGTYFCLRCGKHYLERSSSELVRFRLEHCEVSA
jgi:hypothetical protein